MDIQDRISNDLHLEPADGRFPSHWLRNSFEWQIVLRQALIQSRRNHKASWLDNGTISKTSQVRCRCRLNILNELRWPTIWPIT